MGNRRSLHIEKQPETTVQLILLILKNYMKNFSKNTMALLVRMAIIFLVVLAIHTYLIAFYNNGFSKYNEARFVTLMNLPGTKELSLAFWFLAGFLLTSILEKNFKNFRRFWNDFFQAPFYPLHLQYF
jgi:hypothetical protein